MSVATQLDLHDPTRGLLGQARQQWPTWCAHHPRLAVVEDLIDLPAWLKRAEARTADEVLHTLARVASPTGGDDVTAAGALAWLLLPGACLLAHRLRTLTPRIDEVVAAQLWLEVRGFAWERRRKVAVNIVMDTRRGVLRELGAGEHTGGGDPTWARTIPVEPAAHLWQALAARHHGIETPAAVELAEVLELATTKGVLDPRDRDLLVSLAVAADDGNVTRCGRAQGGLCSRRVVHTVARRAGVSASTVRRRAAASLHAIRAAHAQTLT